MSFDPTKKYRPFAPIHLPNRQWPTRQLTQPPMWCSVDLRDGNQALAVPMNVAQKLDMFTALVECGFKEIEVGFPSASNTEFNFNRRLIEDKRIPDDVTIQCLVQAREDLIEKTVQSLIGAKSVVIHMYNSTSPAQRKHVFGKTKEEILQIAVRGAQMIKDRVHRLEEGGTRVTLQYSPESFSATEVEFAKEISEAVMDVWQPTPEKKMILNLPDTVEVAGPNVYADQIEWICTHIKNRESLIISLHTHNDRGTGTAATELGLLAGADRVEGTLFGNGERTGNLDIVQVAMNLYMHGIDPKLDFSDMNKLIAMYERCTGMTVPPRQPYAGELVFTAFSGSHQDAINKGLLIWKAVNGDYSGKVEGAVRYLLGRSWDEKDKDVLSDLFISILEHPAVAKDRNAMSEVAATVLASSQFTEALESKARTILQRLYADYAGPWDVPYLTIDPHDIGREYREVIRVNSQSGKGGVAYLLESEFGIELPKDLQREFSLHVDREIERLERVIDRGKKADAHRIDVVNPHHLKSLFWKVYIECETPFSLHHFHADGVDGVFKCRCSLVKNGKEIAVNGTGNGPIAAFANALITDAGAAPFEVATYREQSLSSGTGASALAFIQIKTANGKTVWGAGTDTNIELASIKAVLSAVNRAA